MQNIFRLVKCIRVEEYILMLFSIILFFVYVSLLDSRPGALTSFRNGFRNVALGVKYFSFVFVFLYIYFFIKVYFYLIRGVSPLVEGGLSLKRIFFLFKPTQHLIKSIEKFILSVLFFIRPLFFITLFFTLITLVLGLMAVVLKDRLVDQQLMEIDRALFGFYPFLWPLAHSGLLNHLTPFFIFGFSFLGSAMGIAWVVLFLARQRKLFSQYLVAMSTAVMIALPLWFLFPANSPQNSYLNNVYGKEIDNSIAGLLERYQPNKNLSGFLEAMGVKPGEIAPVSTMPSMHVAWSILIVYYLFRVKRKIIFLSLPWAFFSVFGTVHLAQHYFVDILAALPIVVVSIWLANCLVKLEKNYYQDSVYDKREHKVKDSIKGDFILILRFFKNLLSQMRSLIMFR